MGFIWTITELIALLALLLGLGLLTALIFEAFRRTQLINSTDESIAIFEDPRSLKKVPTPHLSDPAEKYISLIIPAFNEEHRLPGALTETMNYLQQRAAKDKSFSFEVIIVDDGSADGTKNVAFDFVRKYAIDNVRVILLGRNYGKGEAIRTGMLHSRGELLLMLDAEGATKVNDLEKLENQVQELSKKEILLQMLCNMILVQKTLPSLGCKWYHNFLMKGFHLVVILTAGPGIRDTQYGFKMFTRAAARKLFRNMLLKRSKSVVVLLVYLSKICNRYVSNICAKVVL